MTTAAHEYDAILPAPFGALGVRIAAGRLTRLEFLPPAPPSRSDAQGVIRQLAAQLAAYFINPAHRFDLPLELIGTPFRRRVWQALLDIPAGHTVTYGELARRLGSGARAVGQALGDNPLPIIIPCHRVVATHGLGGFNHRHNGFSTDLKRWLLRHEGVL